MTNDPAAKPSPPRYAMLAAGALVLSGLGAVGAGASLYDGAAHVQNRGNGKVTTDGSTGVKGWLIKNQIKAKDNKDYFTKNKANSTKIDKKISGLLDALSQQQKGALISSLVLLLALGFAAHGVHRGRYWSRWVVLGLWVLSTFTGTLAGVGYLFGIGSAAPAIFKLPAFVAALFLVVAVVLVNLRPSVEYFNLSRPDKAAGAPPRRGLFAPRQPAPARTKPATTRAAAVKKTATVELTKSAAPVGSAKADDGGSRGRSKQRANADAVAKGADLARTRAKAASKSRRSGT